MWSSTCIKLYSLIFIIFIYIILLFTIILTIKQKGISVNNICIVNISFWNWCKHIFSYSFTLIFIYSYAFLRVYHCINNLFVISPWILFNFLFLFNFSLIIKHIPILFFHLKSNISFLIHICISVKPILLFSFHYKGSLFFLRKSLIISNRLSTFCRCSFYSWRTLSIH